MLEFYLISVAFTIGTNVITQIALKERNLKEGYITKEKRLSKAGFIANVVLTFTPIVNLGFSVFNIVGTTIALKNDKFFKTIMKSRSYSPEGVKWRYEGEKIDKQYITDAMILDGADETIIKEELRQIKKLNSGFAKKNEYGYLLDNPTFNEKDYSLAIAQMQANQFLFDIECNMELTIEEKRELLSSLRKVYLDEFKGKDSTSMQPIIKAEQISFKKAS